MIGDWKIVHRAPRYEVNSDGQIRLRNSNRQPLTGTLRWDGSVQVSLAVEPTVQKTFILHNLVAEAHMTDQELDKHWVVLHRDGDPWNCAVDNLILSTRGEYIRERYRDGRTARRRRRL